LPIADRLTLYAMDGVYAGNAGAISSPAKPEYMPSMA